MTLLFISIRDNGNFLFTKGTPGVYYYERVELSPCQTWNLLQDRAAADVPPSLNGLSYPARRDGPLFEYGFEAPLYLTPDEFKQITALKPDRPDESRHERLRELLDNVDKLPVSAREEREDQVRYYDNENQLGETMILETMPWVRGPLSIPTCELEKAWNTYRARIASPQSIP